MTLSDLFENYCFHDSRLTAVAYNTSKSELEIDVDFCYWMQDDYQEGDPEIGSLLLTFNGVRDFNPPDGLGGRHRILGLELVDNSEFVFVLLDPQKEDVIRLCIKAESVSMRS